MKIIKNLALWKKVLLGMLAGIAFGLISPEYAIHMEFLGTIFINMIKMITIPMIFFTIIYGVTSIENESGLYRISVKAITTFFVTAIFAVIIGLVTSSILKPGLNEDDSEIVKILKEAKKDSSKTQAPKSLSTIVLDIIPTNIFNSFADGHLLHVIIFAMFFGVVMNMLRNKTKGVISITHQIAQVMFKMIAVVMKIAPIGVFGFISALVGKEGLNIMLTLSKLIATIFVGCTVQYILFGLMLIIWGRMSPLPFYKKMLGPQLIALSTSSSKATLVPMMTVAEEEMGVSRQSSRFLLPMSSALNMDGGAIYQASCAIFFSQLLNIDLTTADYLSLIILCTIASIGGAGVPGGVLLFLGMVLNSIGIPTEAVLLIASVDRILDMATTVINVTGDACVTVLVDRSEGTLNINRYNKKYLTEK